MVDVLENILIALVGIGGAWLIYQAMKFHDEVERDERKD